MENLPVCFVGFIAAVQKDPLCSIWWPKNEADSHLSLTGSLPATRRTSGSGLAAVISSVDWRCLFVAVPVHRQAFSCNSHFNGQLQRENSDAYPYRLADQ